MIHDRMYGRLVLPDLAARLARTCPLLLRLREVRMPNIPFYEFPSFANVSRYEHSLGVAHLAYWWARQNQLDEDTGLALTLGALYHDAATPAFSHLFEEFLSRYGFNHETQLANVLGGRPTLDGGQHAQVFLNRSCRLRMELGERAYSGGLLSPTGVGSLVTGRNPLGIVLHGDIDLDNIDNVVRAVTAMGIVDKRDMVHPYDVAQLLRWDGGAVRLATDPTGAVLRWRNLRRRLYGTILSSEREFVAQATIKWAIDLCAEDEPALTDAGAWRFTEPELIHDFLLKNERSRLLINGIRLGNPAPLLVSAWVADLAPLTEEQGPKVTHELCDTLGRILGCEVYVNYYVDKRERPIRLTRARATTLFDVADDLNESAHMSIVGDDARASGTSGIIGVVGFAPNRQKVVDRRALLPECRGALAEVFGVDVSEVDTSWLGTRLSGAGGPGQ